MHTLSIYLCRVLGLGGLLLSWLAICPAVEARPDYYFGRVAERGAMDKPVVDGALEVVSAQVVGVRYSHAAIRDTKGRFPVESAKAYAVTKAGEEVEGVRVLGSLSLLANLDHAPVPWSNPSYETVTYLELPAPMEVGVEYGFRLKLPEGGASSEVGAAIVWDSRKIISNYFKVNQVGYFSGATKRLAYLGKWLGTAGLAPIEPKACEVIDCRTGEVVTTVEPRLRHRAGQANEGPYKLDFSGEDVYGLDLSGLAEGDYFLHLEGVGRSYSFHIGTGSMSEPIFTTHRMLFHNRCRTALDRAHTHWPRGNCKCHGRLAVMPEYRAAGAPQVDRWTEVRQFFEKADTSGAEIEWRDAEGGHHDAADYDQNVDHLRIPEFLCMAYSMNESAFIDSQFGIPESGNGIPDILDEAVWSIRFSLGQQWEDGGIPSGAEAKEHPTNEIHLKEGGDANPLRTTVLNETLRYALLPVTDESCYSYAASAAHLSIHLAKFPQGKALADELLVSATRAFLCAWQRGEPSDPKIRMVAATAACRLLAAAREPKFALFLDKLPGVGKETDWMTMEGACLADAVSSVPDGLGGEGFGRTRDRVSRVFVETVRGAAKTFILNQGYVHFRNPYAPTGWGVATITQAWIPSVAWKVSGREPFFLDLVSMTADSALGANPLGRVQCSGLGQRHIHQPMHLHSMNDGIAEPVPGIWVYGPVANQKHWLIDLHAPVPKWQDIPELYRHFDIDMSPTNAEFTVHQSIAPALILFAPLADPAPQEFTGPLPVPR